MRSINHKSAIICLEFITLLIISVLTLIAGHGRMISPPGRSTAWRFGFPTPVNYNDHETNCGGFGVSKQLIVIIPNHFICR